MYYRFRVSFRSPNVSALSLACHKWKTKKKTKNKKKKKQKTTENKRDLDI
jgi:hypothetical protein